MAGPLIEAIHPVLNAAERVPGFRLDSTSGLDDLPDILSAECPFAVGFDAEVDRGRLGVLSPEQEAEEEIEDEAATGWISEKYLIRKDLRVGTTQLIVAFDTSVAPAVQLSARLVDTTELAEFLVREGHVWAVLRHKPHRNLPQLVACHDPPPSEDGESVGCLFFPAFHSDLHEESLLMGTLGTDRDVTAALAIVKQMVSAVAHCHAQRIVVGAVELTSFMWADSRKTVVQLAVLDGARVLQPGEGRFTAMPEPAPAYTAPEMVGSGDSPVDGFAADVWALGVAAYTIICGEFPFVGKTPRELAGRIRQGLHRAPTSLAPAVAELLYGLLNADPTERLSAAAAAEHRSFALMRHRLRFGRAHSAPSVSEVPSRRLSLPTVSAPPDPWLRKSRKSRYARRSMEWDVPEVPEASDGGAAAAPAPHAGAASPAPVPSPPRLASKRSSLCAEMNDLDFSRVKRRSSLPNNPNPFVS
mmetsp:Transcript_9315/g.23945  ORF Transcript_9315/g.23945 Transcript_9315/m.23945 type:complete len:472 (+) Transcript_9315:283-1698(+)